MPEEHPHPEYPKQYLLQRYVEIDSPGGAWISLKLFKTKEEAEKAFAQFNSGEKGRVIEVVSEPAK